MDALFDDQNVDSARCRFGIHSPPRSVDAFYFYFAPNARLTLELLTIALLSPLCHRYSRVPTRLTFPRPPGLLQGL